jgi:cytochrome c biogenesis protein CcmG, thiol:disulfide interchange protein DsbE
MNWRAVIIALVVTVPVVLLLGYGMTQDPRAIPSPLPGKAAPTFTLAAMKPPASGTAADRDTIRLSAYRGQVVVLNFYASWCLACRDEHATLSQAATEFKGKPVHFFGVMYNDTEDALRQYIQQMGGQTYPTLVDPGAKVAINYGLYGVPETFFIGPDGRVAYKQVGPVTSQVLTTEIDSLLASVPAAAPTPLRDAPAATRPGP